MTDTIERDGLKPGDCVLLTGAGGGFGRALALRYAHAGARIAAWDRHEQNLEETVRLVTEAGGECRGFSVDLAVETQIDSALDKTRAAFGAPYCLLNNASVFPRADPLALSLNDWRRAFDVNLTAAFILAQRLAPAMIAARRGIILNIASGRALQATVEGVSYAASKAGLLSLTKSLALAWAKHNVRVNAIVPGVSLTAQPLETGVTVEDLLSRAQRNIPLGRIGMPEDVAGLAAFLTSADAAFMTGQAVAINGGVIMIP